MILKWGSYAFPLGCCELQVQSRRMKTAAETDWAEEHIWTINGLFQTQAPVAATAIAAIKAKLDAMRDAFQTDAKDLILYEADGATRTHHQLLTAKCIGGTQVMEVNFPDGKGVELLNMRHFTIVVRGLKATPLSALRTGIKSFEETLEFAPAGRRIGHLETKIGRPVAQELRRYTTYRAVQRGSAVGLYMRPSIPAAIWPQALVHAQPLVTKGTPKRLGDDYIDWPVAWEYSYESAFVLTGNPNVWGVTWP